jgi:hypothetical protein
VNKSVTLSCNMLFRRSPISIAAAVIYMITQLSEDKKPLKGLKLAWLSSLLLAC